MLAGALVNKNDISKDLFTPDVQRPKIKNFASDLLSKRIFCPEWPQSLSTEAELMYRSDDIQRIHVTGGTTGITVESLKNGPHLHLVLLIELKTKLLLFHLLIKMNI